MWSKGSTGDRSMTTWLISDSHFLHRNIIKYCGRPTNCDEIMWEKLKVVGPEDTLIHLGDVCFRQHRSKAKEIFDKLPGKVKILVKGNHDKKQPILKCGWDAIYDEYKFEYEGLRFHLQHRPFRKAYEPQKVYWKRLLLQISADIFHRPSGLPDVDIICHGHIHELGQRYRWQEEKLITNCCVEHWGFGPIPLSELVREYHGRKEYFSK